MTIAFDVDGTIVNLDDTPNFKVIDLLRWFSQNGDRVIVWSGGGGDYAKMWADRFNLPYFTTAMKDRATAKLWDIDIVVDDEFVKLGKVNIKVNKLQ